MTLECVWRSTCNADEERAVVRNTVVAAQMNEIIANGELDMVVVWTDGVARRFYAGSFTGADADSTDIWLHLDPEGPGDGEFDMCRVALMGTEGSVVLSDDAFGSEPYIACVFGVDPNRKKTGEPGQYDLYVSDAGGRDGLRRLPQPRPPAGQPVLPRGGGGSSARADRVPRP